MKILSFILGVIIAILVFIVVIAIIGGHYENSKLRIENEILKEQIKARKGGRK